MIGRAFDFIDAVLHLVAKRCGAGWHVALVAVVVGAAALVLGAVLLLAAPVVLLAELLGAGVRRVAGSMSPMLWGALGVLACGCGGYWFILLLLDTVDLMR